MRSLLTASFPAERYWEFSYLFIAIYLLLHPALVYPQSNAVILGGGLVLLLLRSIPEDSSASLGSFWMAFLFYALFSSVWSVSSGLTLQSAGFLFLGTLLYVMARQNNPAIQSRIENFILFFAFGAALFGLYQRLIGFQEFAFLPTKLMGEEAKIVAAAVHDKRASGPLTTSGALAALLIFTLPQSLIRVWVSNGTKRILFGFLSLGLLGGLWATGSVGAWFCLALAMLVLLWKQGFRLKAVALSGFVLFVALMVVWERGFHSWSQASYSMRLELWRSAWGLFLQHPFIGSGLGTFGEAYQRAGLDLGTGSIFAHNIILQLSVETGLAGFAFFVLAIFSAVRRFKWPALWEGWGVLGGGLAVLFFSLLDLPFQMTELIWIFAVAAGRLEMSPENLLKIKEISPRWLLVGLVVVLGVTGFWKPFKPWNFCLLAVSLWTLLALFQCSFERVERWIAVGSLFLLLRAFMSTSASGTVWFLELAGILTAFYLILSGLPKSSKFLEFFAGLGLLWAAKVWWFSLFDGPSGLMNWFRYQTLDVKEWNFYPNPKQLAVFLIPLIFLLWTNVRSAPQKKKGWKVFGLVFSLLTVIRLKAEGAVLGIGIGMLALVSVKKRQWAWVGLFLLLAALAGLRFLDNSSTKWERIGICESAVKVWSREPLVGVGPGAFAGLYHQVKSPRSEGISRYLMDARYVHDEFVECLTAFGLVGVVFVLCLLWKAWGRVKDKTRRSALMGLGAASAVDFCLHTPLIALQAVGLLTESSEKKTRISYAGGFLALGLTVGLFGAPVYSAMLKDRSEKDPGLNPEGLRCLTTAENLNAWDFRYTAAKGEYLERLYLATHDRTWKRKSDEAFERALDLERTDGDLRFENARRLTRRFNEGLEEKFGPSLIAWAEAEKAMPLNAFVHLEKGVFFTRLSHWNGDGVFGREVLLREEALKDCEKAVELEPNFAAAWFNLGSCRIEKGRRLGDREEKKRAKEDFKKALDIYDRWKNTDGMTSVEKEMVDLPPDRVELLRKEFAP